MKHHRWTTKDIPSLTGKTALVTGANSGVGYHTTLELARKGARVIMACRSAERGGAARNRIKSEVPGAELEVMALDLASLASIRAFSEAVQSQFTRLDILVNNAGVMAIPRRETADGFEMQFGTNHLGHFALTGLLLGMITATPDSRVVTVSSEGHRTGAIRFNDLMGKKFYHPWLAYFQSKLANILFAYELQGRLEAMYSPTRSLAAHPGYAATHLQFVSAEMRGSMSEQRFFRFANGLAAQPAGRGALPQLYAATAPQATGGTYIGPKGLAGLRGYPGVVKSSPRSYNMNDARRLWQVSEQLTGVKYP